MFVCVELLGSRTQESRCLYGSRAGSSKDVLADVCGAEREPMSKVCLRPWVVAIVIEVAPTARTRRADITDSKKDDSDNELD